MKVRTITNWNGSGAQRYVKAEIAEALLEALINTTALVDLKYGNTDEIANTVIKMANAAIKKAEE